MEALLAALIGIAPFVGLYFLSITISGVIGGFVWQSRGGDFTDGFWMGLGLSLVGIWIAALARPYSEWSPERGPMQPPALVPQQPFASEPQRAQVPVLH